VDGTGGAAVNAMFASAMSRYAMSGDKLGLADMIYRSTAGKTQPATAPQSGAADTTAQSTAATTKNDPAPLSPGSGISLTPYWIGNGHRPLGPPIGRMTPPGSAPAMAKAASGHGQDGKLARTGTSAHVNMPIAAAETPKTATVAPTQMHPADHSFWDWLGMPSLLHFIFPSSETPTPNQSVATGHAIPGATIAAGGAIPVASDITPATAGNAGPVPYGLPWTHRPGGPVTDAPNRPQGNDAANATGAAPAAPTDAESFAQNLAPAIEQAAQRLGVSPRVLLAQAALETGWGHSVVGNNIFGIKAGSSWSGATVAANTHEMTDGRLIAHRASFRSYDNVGQAVDDYVALVSASNRYRSALGAGDNPAAYAQALTAGGYATDRDYVAKLTAVADSPTMSDAVAALNEDEPGQLVSAHG
jgi:flagellum-specific peptidoglycan hydrolase FlgJ